MRKNELNKLKDNLFDFYYMSCRVVRTCMYVRLILACLHVIEIVLFEVDGKVRCY